VPEAWLAAPGVGIRGLPTHFGPLDLALVASGEGEVRVSVGGAVTDPPGGIVLVSPLARPIREVVVGGRTRATLDPRSVRLDGAAEVVLRYV
jgi:hypothetical protein